MVHALRTLPALMMRRLSLTTFGPLRLSCLMTPPDRFNPAGPSASTLREVMLAKRDQGSCIAITKSCRGQLGVKFTGLATVSARQLSPR